MAQKRLDMDMDIREAVKAMCGGDADSIDVCMQLLAHGADVDPYSSLGGFSTIMNMDGLGIWDERIYMLWNDVCGRHAGKMIAVIRAYQLGQLAGVTEAALNHAIANRGQGINLDAVVEAVQKKLKQFNVEAAPA